jgi:predicted phage terminase large subunit-like protein
MPSEDQVLEARREQARRKMAREDLLAFAWYTFRVYRAAAVHRVLAAHLAAVERYVRTGGSEGIGRLMVFMPPRHGKSELVSVRFPAWFLGRNPNWRVILACCTASLAVSFSRQVRDTIRDVPYQAVFGATSGLPEEERVLLSTESRSAEAWDVQAHTGGMVTAGVGGSIVGRGMHLGIIDDPFKNREEAESARVRERVDNWYRSTFYTRLEQAGAVVLMHQRWHSDDLAGRLLRRMVEEEGTDRWTVLNLPAIAEPWADGVTGEDVLAAARNGWWKCADALGREPGAVLWPGKYDLEALRSIEANLGAYEWEALYQQRPQRLEGALIKAHQILQIRRDQVPEGLREVRYWDLAVSKRKRADYISGARVGRGARGNLYIEHLARLRGPWADARPRMMEVMLADGPGVVQGIETSGQQAGYFQELQRDARLQGLSIVGVNPQEVGSKEIRANIWASRIQDGIVHLVVGNGWDVEAFVSECLVFPLGEHDDLVDGVSGAVQMLGQGGARMAELPQPPSRDSRWDLFGEMGGISQMARELRQGSRW